MRRRPALRVLAAWACGALGPSTPHARAGGSSGLGTATAFVSVDGLGRSVRLDARAARAVLDAVWLVLGDVPVIAPVAGGPRLLAALRLNEQVLDVTVWKPQTLVVAARRLPNVSAIVIPVTGPWRHRVLLVQTGQVTASPRLVDSPALAAIDDAVRTAVGPR